MRSKMMVPIAIPLTARYRILSQVSHLYSRSSPKRRPVIKLAEILARKGAKEVLTEKKRKCALKLAGKRLFLAPHRENVKLCHASSAAIRIWRGKFAQS